VSQPSKAKWSLRWPRQPWETIARSRTVSLAMGNDGLLYAEGDAVREHYRCCSDSYGTITACRHRTRSTNTHAIPVGLAACQCKLSLPYRSAGAPVSDRGRGRDSLPLAVPVSEPALAPSCNLKVLEVQDEVANGRAAQYTCSATTG
jgi:hypothetical protein